MDVVRLDSDHEYRDLSLPPHSEQAELAVMGSVLKNPRAIERVSDFLRAQDFYDQRSKHVFHAMLTLLREGTPIDYHTVCDKLEQQGTYEAAGGIMYLGEVNLSTPTSAHIEHYGRIVERTSIMRQLIQKAQTIAELAYRDNLDPDVALAKAAQLIAAVSDNRRSTAGPRPLSDILGDYMDELTALQDGEVVRYGIPTGYMDIDKLLGGFQRTDLILLAARTSVGKTALAMNFIVNASVKHNAKVLVFSLEMSSSQLASRMLSMESGVDSPRIRSAHLNEQESRKLDASMNHLAGASIWVDDSAALSALEICSRARRLSAEVGLDMIVVDYVQLIAGESGDDNRVRELDDITKALKNLARELNVPIIALSQLSRAVENRADHTPQLSDLRESGGLEQNADVVMFIYRAEKYDPDTDKKGVADIIVAKHRNGPTGQAQLLFIERTTKFLDLEVYRS